MALRDSKKRLLRERALVRGEQRVAFAGEAGEKGVQGCFRESGGSTDGRQTLRWRDRGEEGCRLNIT